MGAGTTEAGGHICHGWLIIKVYIFQHKLQKYKHYTSFPADNRSQNIVSLHEKKHQRPLINREMQIKIKMKCHFVHTYLTFWFFSKNKIVKAKRREVVKTKVPLVLLTVLYAVESGSCDSGQSEDVFWLSHSITVDFFPDNNCRENSHIYEGICSSIIYL